MTSPRVWRIGDPKDGPGCSIPTGNSDFRVSSSKTFAVIVHIVAFRQWEADPGVGIDVLGERSSAEADSRCARILGVAPPAKQQTHYARSKITPAIFDTCISMLPLMLRLRPSGRSRTYTGPVNVQGIYTQNSADITADFPSQGLATRAAKRVRACTWHCLPE